MFLGMSVRTKERPVIRLLVSVLMPLVMVNVLKLKNVFMVINVLLSLVMEPVLINKIV